MYCNDQNKGVVSTLKNVSFFIIFCFLFCVFISFYSIFCTFFFPLSSIQVRHINRYIRISWLSQLFEILKVKLNLKKKNWSKMHRWRWRREYLYNKYSQYNFVMLYHLLNHNFFFSLFLSSCFHCFQRRRDENILFEWANRAAIMEIQNKSHYFWLAGIW